MRATTLAVVTFVAAGLAAVAGSASAVTCFMVFDRTENVIYRDVYPPVDLSDQGRAEREAMRARGEFMMFMDSEQCPRLEFFTGAAGTVALRLDQTMSPDDVARPAANAKPAPATAPAPKARAPRASAAKPS